MEIALILNDIRSCHNVGSILRSADCFGISQVFFAGLTPYPKINNDQRLPHLVNKLSAAIHKTALGAEETIKLSVFGDGFGAILAAREQGFIIAGLEQSEAAVSLLDYSPPKKLAIILGNEVSGLSMQTLKACDVILDIPMLGTKESLNVSIAGAIAMYAIRAKEN